MYIKRTSRYGTYVAPFVGAWIEILDKLTPHELRQSLPSWERGLKYETVEAVNAAAESLPSWERGLKYDVLRHAHIPCGRSLRGSVD